MAINLAKRGDGLAEDTIGGRSLAAMLSSPLRLRLLLAAWFIVGMGGAAVVEHAAPGATDAIRWAVRIGAVGTWAAVMVALAVPATVSLTVARMLVPFAPLAAAIDAVAGSPANRWAPLLAAGVAVAGLVLSADFGRAFAQGSAYGDEERFPLRPPVAIAATSLVLWCVGSAAVFWGALADHPVAVSVAAVIVGAGVLVLLGRAAHQLSRRFLVFVPAGLVVHDPMVLADNVMLPRDSVRQIALAEAGTTATDCTGQTAGMAVEITAREPQPVALAGRAGRAASVGHVTAAILVAPSRPGDFLAAARRRRLATTD
jgi:hypothetical protein